MMAMQHVLHVCNIVDDSAQQQMKGLDEAFEKARAWLHDFVNEAEETLKDICGSAQNGNIKMPKTPNKKKARTRASVDSSVERLPAPKKRGRLGNRTSSSSFLLQEGEASTSKGKKSTMMPLALSSDDEITFGSSVSSLAISNPARDSSVRRTRLSKRLSTQKSNSVMEEANDSMSRLSFKRPSTTYLTKKSKSTKLSRKVARKSLNKTSSTLNTLSESDMEEIDETKSKAREDKKLEALSSANLLQNEKASVEYSLPVCQILLTKIDQVNSEVKVATLADMEEPPKIESNVLIHPTPINVKTGDLKPRSSLRPKMPIMSVSPKSPRQLFSPYTRQSVKSKAMVFENLQQTPARLNTISKIIPGTVVIKAARKSLSLEDEVNNVSPPLKKSPRKSILNVVPEGYTNGLILAKYDKMSLSQRRRSSVRLSMNMVKNKAMKAVLQKHRSSTNTKVDTKEAIDSYDEDNNNDNDEYITDSSDGESENQSPRKKAHKTSKEATRGKRATLAKKSSFSKKLIDPSATIKPLYPGSESRDFAKSRVAYFNSLSKTGSTYGSGSKTKQMVSRITPSGGSCGKINSTVSRTGGNLLRTSSSTSKLTLGATIVQKKHDSWLQEELEKRKQKEQAVLQKREQLMKEKSEAYKKKNEEKHMKVLEKRQQMFKAKEERKRTIELKKEQYTVKKQMLEETRREELEKKRLEEIATRLKLQAQRDAQLAEERKTEIKFEEPKPMEKVATELPKPIPKALAQTKQALNETFNADTSRDTTGYDITPHHTEMPPQKLVDPENYDIIDIKSDDDTDDESAPKKQIPAWAQGTKLHMLIRRQNRSNVDVESIFPLQDIMQGFDLTKVFPIHRRRFFNRTSSAVWHVAPVL